jgi:hypothetical protein
LVLGERGVEKAKAKEDAPATPKPRVYSVSYFYLINPLEINSNSDLLK